MASIISRFLLCWALCICISACQTADSPNLVDEDYAVYSAYFDSFSFYKNVSPAEQIVVMDTTTMRQGDIHSETTWAWVLANLGDKCKYEKDTTACRKARESDWEPIFETFKQSSQGNQFYILPSKLKVPYSIQLYSQFHKSSINRFEDGSSAYYIFSLSKITYNADRTKALFFGSFICGGTCGRGELIMLEKDAKTWKLIDRFRFWIA